MEEKSKNIFGTIDNLIEKDNKFILDKTKLYCEYSLRLDKDNVNRIAENFYEECENYLKELKKLLNISNIDMRNKRIKNL